MSTPTTKRSITGRMISWYKRSGHLAGHGRRYPVLTSIQTSKSCISHCKQNYELTLIANRAVRHFCICKDLVLLRRYIHSRHAWLLLTMVMPKDQTSLALENLRSSNASIAVHLEQINGSMTSNHFYLTGIMPFADARSVIHVSLVSAHHTSINTHNL